MAFRPCASMRVHEFACNNSLLSMTSMAGHPDTFSGGKIGLRCPPFLGDPGVGSPPGQGSSSMQVLKEGKRARRIVAAGGARGSRGPSGCGSQPDRGNRSRPDRGWIAHIRITRHGQTRHGKGAAPSPTPWTKPYAALSQSPRNGPNCLSVSPSERDTASHPAALRSSDCQGFWRLSKRQRAATFGT